MANNANQSALMDGNGRVVSRTESHFIEITLFDQSFWIWSSCVTVYSSFFFIRSAWQFCYLCCSQWHLKRVSITNSSIRLNRHLKLLKEDQIHYSKLSPLQPRKRKQIDSIVRIFKLHIIVKISEKSRHTTRMARKLECKWNRQKIIESFKGKLQRNSFQKSSIRSADKLWKPEYAQQNKNESNALWLSRMRGSTRRQRTIVEQRTIQSSGSKIFQFTETLKCKKLRLLLR